MLDEEESQMSKQPWEAGTDGGGTGRAAGQEREAR